jgi:hypothetical protein
MLFVLPASNTLDYIYLFKDIDLEQQQLYKALSLHVLFVYNIYQTLPVYF